MNITKHLRRFQCLLILSMVTAPHIQAYDASQTLNTSEVLGNDIYAMPEKIEVDNSDETNTSSDGSIKRWIESTNIPGFIGKNYLYDGNSDKGKMAFQFKAPIPYAGAYEIYFSVIAHKNRATSVPITVTDINGERTVKVNENPNGGMSGQVWVSLGTYWYHENAIAKVAVSTVGTQGYVVVDAIRIVNVPHTGAASNNYKLSWGDEFDGTELNRSQWRHRIDSKGYSTQLPENVTVSDGVLHLALRKKETTVDGKKYSFTGGGVGT